MLVQRCLGDYNPATWEVALKWRRTRAGAGAGEGKVGPPSQESRCDL